MKPDMGDYKYEEVVEGEVVGETPTRRRASSKRNHSSFGLRRPPYILALLLLPTLLLLLLLLAAGTLSNVLLPLLTQWILPILLIVWLLWLGIAYTTSISRRPEPGRMYMSAVGWASLLWLLCFLTVLQYWGVVATVVGIVLLGIGVIPFGFVAAIVAGDWVITGSIVVLVMLGVGSYRLALIKTWWR